MEKELKKRFTYHPPKKGQPEKYETIRGALLEVARMVVENCPDSRERSLALTKLEEGSMWANASIARNE